jgi:hypothetical protein
MATKKSTSKAPAPAARNATPRVTKADKAKARKATAKKPAGPKAALVSRHGSKESLVGSLIGTLVRSDENKDVLQARLLKASSSQLLRLARVVETVNKKYGSRDKLIDAIAAATKSSKDKDYLAKLATYSLPRLLDLASSKQRAARQ